MRPLLVLSIEWKRADATSSINELIKNRTFLGPASDPAGSSVFRAKNTGATRIYSPGRVGEETMCFL